MSKTKNLYTVAERLATIVEGVEVVRVNSGFTINVVRDEWDPSFKNKNQAVAFLSDLAQAQGVNNETIREVAGYSGGVPRTGLSGWEEAAILRLLPDDQQDRFKGKKK